MHHHRTHITVSDNLSNTFVLHPYDNCSISAASFFPFIHILFVCLSLTFSASLCLSLSFHFFSTAIRAWDIPTHLTDIFSFIFTSNSMKKKFLADEKKLHSSVFEYIEMNNLYFFSPKVRRKRLYRRLLLASASLAAVAGIALIRLRVKYR